MTFRSDFYIYQTRKKIAEKENVSELINFQNKNVEEFIIHHLDLIWTCFDKYFLNYNTLLKFCKFANFNLLLFFK